MRFHDLDVHVPHLVQQHSVGLYKTTLSTMLVFDFEIIHEFLETFHAQIKQDPFSVLLLRATFLKIVR